jgi:hypothetical protein
VAFLTRLNGRYPQAAAVALLRGETLAAETLLAEAGAIAVFRSLLDAPVLARLAQRQLAIASPTNLSVSEFVADRLPWPAHASH